MTTSAPPIRRRRWPPRAPRGLAVVKARETQQDWWDWTWVVSEQLKRLPSGRRVTRYEVFGDVCVLRSEMDGD